MKIEGEYKLNWLDKLEKKLGRFAIPNLTVYLLAGYVIGFAIYYLAPGLLGWLTLEPAYILRGQNYENLYDRRHGTAWQSGCGRIDFKRSRGKSHRSAAVAARCGFAA